MIRYQVAIDEKLDEAFKKWSKDNRLELTSVSFRLRILLEMGIKNDEDISKMLDKLSGEM